MAWAAVGAATSAARLSAEQTAHAFGIAGANTPLPTLREWADLIDLPMMKVADAGWVAQTGIAATLLAELGSTGYSEILDKKVGFWRFFGGDALDRQALLGGLGTEWRILDTTYKPWPSCRWIHYPLTAFVNLRREHGLRADEIERIVVRANPFSLSKRFHVQQPTTMINAEFSYAHSLAMVAHEVPIGPLWYSEENMHGAPVRELRARVEVTPEPLSANLANWLQGGQFRRLPGGVDVHARGRVFSATVDNAGGDPWTKETLMTDDMIREKFLGMVGCRSGANADKRVAWARRVMDAVEHVHEFEDIREFTRMLAFPL
jgi:2-methylcitrate dehydratase PrpD